MLDKEELWSIRKFTVKQEADKAFHTLKGLIEGINIDKEINPTEVQELKNWCNNHYEFITRKPFNEVIPFVQSICEDNIITQSEYEDLEWFISKLTNPNKYFDVITGKIQELQGLFHGILADNVITDKEVSQLEKWLFDNEVLVNTYPFDEVETLVVKILQDKIITNEERDLLKVFMGSFVAKNDNSTIDFNKINEMQKKMTIPGICTLNPDIEFKDNLFCFTGISPNFKRKDIVEKIETKGGVYNDHITLATNYLIIGSKSNPCWAFSCYGRKVEAAEEMRRQGKRISIVAEVDFNDALID